GKVFYGLLYKEVFLVADRKNPRSGPIIPRSLLQRFRMLHLFLQSCRIPMRFENFFPSSFFVFDAQELPDRKANFDLRDNLFTMFISLRMGRVVVMGCLQDGGALEYYLSRLYRNFKTLKLHPLQYTEIVARLIYTSSLFN